MDAKPSSSWRLTRRVTYLNTGAIQHIVAIRSDVQSWPIPILIQSDSLLRDHHRILLIHRECSHQSAIPVELVYGLVSGSEDGEHLLSRGNLLDDLEVAHRLKV